MYNLSLSKKIYSKEAIYSSIKEWKEHLEIEISSKNKNQYDLKFKENNNCKIEEFLNYVLDKTSMEEIVA